MKAKRTLAVLKKPAKSPPKGNYDRIIAKSFVEAERSGSTVSDQRLKERRAGKQIAQLGEQAKQSGTILGSLATLSLGTLSGGHDCFACSPSWGIFSHFFVLLSFDHCKYFPTGTLPLMSFQ